MLLNLIHDPLDPSGRSKQLLSELQQQEIEVRIWRSMHDAIAPHSGVSRAHKQIIRWAKEQGLPEIIIGEDDVRFLGAGAWKRFLESKPAEFDIYTAGTYCGTIEPDGRVFRFCGTHCYIVHEKFYDVFLSADEEEHIDQWLRGLGMFIVCRPFAAIQWDDFSTNFNKVHDRTKMLAKYKDLIP